MIPGQAKSLVALIALVASLFFMAQLVGWSWARIIVGATRRFAQGIIGFVVSGALAYQVLRLEGATGPRFASGPTLDLVANWWVSVFAFVPVLTIVESILVCELVVMKQREPGLRGWHIGALGTCATWLTVVMLLDPANRR